jgi:phosphohistidine swiveling domain-containing protein
MIRIKGINWERIVYVKEAPIMNDALGLRHSRTPKILDGHYSIPHQTYLYLDGEIYYGDIEIREYDLFVVKNLSNLKKILNLVRKIVLRFAKKESKFDQKKLQRLSNIELARTLNDFSLLYQNALSTLYIPVALDKVLSQIIKDYIANKFSDRVMEIFNALTPIFKENDSVKYHRALEKIALQYRKLSKAELQDRLEKLARKYKYLGIKFGYGKPYTAKVFYGQLKEISRHNLKQEIAGRQKKRLKERKDYLEATKELRPNQRMRGIIEALRETIFVRTYRLERLSEGETNFLVLLEEIGRRISVPGKILINARFYEIVSALLGKTRINAKTLNSRQRPFGMISYGRKVEYFFGKDYNKFYKKIKLIKYCLSEVRGQIAYPGIVRGKVRLIWEDKDISQLRKGEILVTRMTTPDYIFAIQKSAAIVTDIGGVTSHASVISRELGKPCVIGTINATRALKTGDLVEVDADKGIVKKL